MSQTLELRALTNEEYKLTKWMLEHGNADALPFLPHLELAQAISQRCPCGCASFDFAVKGHKIPEKQSLHILGDFLFGPEDEPSGIFVFAQGGVLSGVEVYGLAGDAPKALPDPETLRRL